MRQVDALTSMVDLEGTNMNTGDTILDRMEIIRANQSELPVSVTRIAREFGIRVFKSSGWPDKLSGLIRKNQGKYEIFVNGQHPLVRRRFTIAHELAHFILHRDEIGNGITDDVLYRSGLSNKMEKEANQLAADILMPWKLLDPILDSGESDIRKLADMFKVSPSTMSIRLGVPYEGFGERPPSAEVTEAHYHQQ